MKNEAYEEHIAILSRGKHHLYGDADKGKKPIQKWCGPPNRMLGGYRSFAAKLGDIRLSHIQLAVAKDWKARDSLGANG